MKKWFETLRFRIRERLARRVRVSDGDFMLTFRCDSPIETWRAKTIQTKESGTVAWIKREVHEGDVFVDVGANIGLYTIMAAKRVGKSGAVYAFEPHLGNAFSLLRNCELNGVCDTVTVITTALNDRDEFSPFNYQAWLPGSSMSQFGTTLDDEGREIHPVFSELKHGTRLDVLVAQGIIRSPNLIKIDVDGNEPRVLDGMREILAAHPPRSIQVEVGPRNQDRVVAIMQGAAYARIERHDTTAGKKKLHEGADPKSVAHNIIFAPVCRKTMQTIGTRSFEEKARPCD